MTPLSGGMYGVERAIIQPRGPHAPSGPSESSSDWSARGLSLHAHILLQRVPESYVATEAYT